MESPNEKFMRIYPKRLRNASAAIATLGKLSQPYQYEATEAEWAKIINRLRQDLRDLEDAARNQVLASRRRAERAQHEEGAPHDGFAVDARQPEDRPWSA
jgi:hypothetical protein